jgi:hypothetical protein
LKLGGGRAAELDTHKKFCESNAFGSEVLDSAKDAVVEFPWNCSRKCVPCARWGRGASDAREQNKLFVVEGAAKRSEPTIVHTKFQLVIEYRKRQVVNKVKLTLLVNRCLALTELSDTACEAPKGMRPPAVCCPRFCESDEAAGSATAARVMR